MPYLVVTSRVPISKAKEAAEIYMKERQLFPPDRSIEKEVLQGMVRIKGKKMISIVIFKVKEGMLEKSFMRHQEAILLYHGLEGYEYEIETFLSFAEAMPLVGMTAPD